MDRNNKIVPHKALALSLKKGEDARMADTMRQNLLKWQQIGLRERKDYITLRRGGAVQIEEGQQVFQVNFFAYNGKKKTVEVMLKPTEYEVLELAERNHFIELTVKHENAKSIIYFSHDGNFVAMGSKESFVAKNGSVYIVSRCGHLYNELSLQKMYT